MNKRLLAILVAMGMVLVLVGPAAADWPNSVPKWDQMSQGADPWGGASWINSGGSALCVDDFLCAQPVPVTDIKFAGFYDLPPERFRITFWSDVPGTVNEESKPGSLLYDQMIRPANPGDPLRLGWQDMGDGTFKINLPETQWFWQHGDPTNPTVYWVGIQAMSPAGIFYWNFKDRTKPTWNDDAGFWSDYYGYPAWAHWGWTSLDPGTSPSLYYGLLPPDWIKSADMDFVLTTTSVVPVPTAAALSALGGLLLGLVRVRRWRKQRA
jgi:hypothetical protein